MTVYPYGRGRIELPDVQDFRHLMRNRVAEEEGLPSSIEYATGPTLNQGTTSECVGYSWQQWLVSEPLVQVGPGATTIYCGAQQNDPWPGDCSNPQYEGSTVRGGAKWLQDEGYIKEYLWAFNVRDISLWMRSGHGPIVLGTNWYTSMFGPDRYGEIKVDPKSGGAGGHAYLCIGMDEKIQMALCKNSWGNEWGREGKFWISYVDLEFLMNRGGEACTATELLKNIAEPDEPIVEKKRCKFFFWR